MRASDSNALFSSTNHVIIVHVYRSQPFLHRLTATTDITTMAGNLSVGRLQAALASATNEVTVAAANINFDFALVKCEAPPEYLPLLQTMSAKRQTEAEGGSQHVTARRLGALFDGACPNVPKLISAYGKRATEISRDTAASSQQNPTTTWFFSEYAGIDSTSLWAAATSSKAALPVFLLACLLARAWSDADATSLWVEIVAERRREIASRFENGEPMSFSSATAAAQQEITREQLAKWDASARAWLRTSDVVKDRQRKQFLLIANNISIPVNAETQPFQSIIPAWVSALDSMEKIIAGEPHAVTNGSVLLAISAWHVYPNMIVFSGKTGEKIIDMKDHLVHPAGVVSLGLSDSEPRVSRGVYWSLSLAHHRFYGRPIAKSSELNGDGSRLTFAELQMVTLGVLLQRWGVPPVRANETLKSLLQIASSLPRDTALYGSRWVEIFIHPIMRYFEDEAAAAPLISLGRRRTSFIPKSPDKSTTDEQFFGLGCINTVLGLLETSENRIQLLRRLSGRTQNIEYTEPLIAFKQTKDIDQVSKQYLNTSSPSAEESDEKFDKKSDKEPEEESVGESDEESNHDWYLATAVPTRIRMDKPSFYITNGSIGPANGRQIHCRWTGSENGPRPPPPPELDLSPSHMPFTRTRTILLMKNSNIMLHFLFGDADSAAVFIVAKSWDTTQRLLTPSLGLDDIVWCIQHDLLPAKKLNHFLKSLNNPVIYALSLLTFASDVYSTLSTEGATISPQLLNAPFDLPATRHTWYDPVTLELQKGKYSEKEFAWYIRFDENMVVALALIAYFETGKVVLLPNTVKDNHVIGISSGNSIYVPSKVSSHRQYYHIPS